MLKVLIDVHSGIQHFIDRPVNKAQRHLFLQGILLYLMGERISLHALRDPQHSDPEQQKRTATALNDFLSKLELKGCVTTTVKNVDVMSFSQHKKFGVPRYSAHKIQSGKLHKLSSDDGRLNKDYVKYIDNGLFDPFALGEREIEAIINNNDYFNNLKKLTNTIQQRIADDASSNKQLSSQLASAIIGDIKKYIPSIKQTKQRLDLGNSPFNVVTQHSLDASDAIKIIKSSKASDEIKQLATRVLTKYQCRLILYAHEYLSLFVAKKGPCSAFGLQKYDFKVKAVLQTLLESFEYVERSPLMVKSPNAETEFYKTIISAPSYGVATSTPVKSIRYDGSFELFIQSEDDEMLRIVREKINSSNRYYLRVGKLCLGKLRCVTGPLPPSTFSNITDDILQ